ncbi:MAG: class I SAM-dependent methyltransferase [Betaproteobacteria bacterium]
MHASDAISPWVRRWGALVAPGAQVLDVACGAGRHARWFTQRGCVVAAAPRDATLAARFVGSARIHFVAADIEGAPWPYAGRQFDAIVVTNYLHRPLWPGLLAALAPGGLLIYETFAQGNEAFGKPSNPDFLLAPGELLQVCATLHVLGFEDGVVNVPKPARVQRICARRIAPASLAGLYLPP